jgi:glycosyltransferase involved in cell wall biosynthesis
VKRLRIAFALPSLYAGGAERVMLGLLQALPRERFAPTLVVGARTGALADQIPKDVAVLELGDTRSRRVAVDFGRTIRALEPDVLFATAGFDLAAGTSRPLHRSRTALVVRLANTPSAHRDEVWRRDRARAAVFVATTATVGRIADRVICQSDYMLDDAVRSLWLPRERLTRIYNPVDVARLEADARDPSPRVGAPAIVSVGNLHHRKGYDLLLSAFARLRASQPRAVLTLVGEGDEREPLEALARSLKVESAVRLLGYQPAPARFIASADLFVSASRYEGFANVLLEARALGVPVLATDCPSGNREIIEDGVTGWLCEPSEGGLYEGLTRALSRPLSRSALALKAEIVERFAPERIVAEYVRVFEESHAARAAS